MTKKPVASTNEWVHPSTLDPTRSFRVLVQHLDLVDEDFNPEGIAEGVLCPTNDDGTRDAVCAAWSGEQDSFYDCYVSDVQVCMLLPGVNHAGEA